MHTVKCSRLGREISKLKLYAFTVRKKIKEILTESKSIKVLNTPERDKFSFNPVSLYKYIH